MPLKRDEHGIWTANLIDSEIDSINPQFAEATTRYATIFDEIFNVAKCRNELEFLFCLFRVRGAENPGWEPYQTTRAAQNAPFPSSLGRFHFCCSRSSSLFSRLAASQFRTDL